MIALRVVFFISMAVVSAPRIATFSAAASLSGKSQLEPLGLSFEDAHTVVVKGNQVQWVGADGIARIFSAARSGDEALTIQVSRWDPQAVVYVSAGSDAQPGVAGVDDEGNGVVDDPAELGATGSDDEVLTPEHPDYPKAQVQALTAMRLSRGAMREVRGDAVIQGPGQVRIDWIGDPQRLSSRIIDLTGW